ETEIAVTAEDFCDSINPVGGLRFRYLLFLDLDGDANNVMETVISSADINTRPVGQVRYNNYQNQNYGGGYLWTFDNNSNQNQRYRFDIDQTANGAKVIWRNNAGTKLPELAHGRHKIKWIAEDGCGNEAVCEKTFEIRDCKPPVVACANVNINLMVGGMATLWASDFFLYGDDNCTPDNILEPKLAVIRADENPGNVYPGGAPDNQSIIVTCDDFATGEPVAVQVWLIDAAGNADFCIAYVDPQENLVGCGPVGSSATVAGALATENTNGIDQVAVAFNIAPSMNVTQVADGNYAFTSVPMGSNVTVTPAKDNDPLNGVTTYDLVLISKHILGLEPLTTPYKMIAADANRSGSITTFDIVEFRKLILGIYEELPANTSWRFVDKAFSFPNAANPFQSTFPENMSINNLAASYMNGDFVGVKIGDVNASVVANSLQTAEARTAGTLVFDVAAASQSVNAGEEVVVNFKAAEKSLGYQFTMNFDGLEVVEVVPGANMTTDNFGVFADAITASAEGNATEFAVKFRAVKSGDLSRMLGVSSRITKAEAYTEGGERNEVAFRFQNNGPIVGTGFELYQNQPNPVVGKTSISFSLPESAEATLKITTVEGRVVKVVKGAFAKGLNTVTLNRAELETGILFYELSTANNSAVKKMIIVD
ncbi:MAG: T9SS type A sorting domain-containing protein, partial [Saprospiraceae bacterium]|nr:T9SS type A sorting domain-containing protein [Saprospiraceae bacterium]